MVRLNRTYYSLLKFTSKIFKNCLPQLNSSELRKFRAIRPHSPRIPQNSHYSVNLFYIMFQAPAPAENSAEFQRIKQIPRNSPTQSTNYTKFTHFVNLFYIMFQAPAPTENAQEFQRIMQIPRNSPTQSANHAKFAPFANITPYVSDA